MTFRETHSASFEKIPKERKSPKLIIELQIQKPSQILVVPKPKAVDPEDDFHTGYLLREAEIRNKASAYHQGRKPM